MRKIWPVLITAALALSAGSALAERFNEEFPPTQSVPDAGTSVTLLATAMLGLTGCRFFFKKKN